MKRNGDQGPVSNADFSRMPDNEVRIRLKKLQARIAQERLCEEDFIAAVAEIVATTPSDLSSIAGLLIAQDIREMEQVWRAGLERPLS